MNALIPLKLLQKQKVTENAIYNHYIQFEQYNKKHTQF